MSKNDVVLSRPELSLVVSLGHNPIPIANGKVGVDVLLEINPTIPQNPAQPLDLVFVVDCSGSMGHRAGHRGIVTKIQAVREALVKMLQKMSPYDRIRVIGFSDDAFEILPWTLIGRCDVHAVTEKLNTELHARSGTYFAHALKMSLEDGLGTNGHPIVVFLTDGQSSAQHTDHPFLVSFADEVRAKKIPLIIYGTGADYNLNLLSQIAIRAGNGSLLYHVLSVEDLESHLTGEMAFLHGHCLENVHVSVFNALAKFENVFRFVPQERQLKTRNQNKTEHHDGGSFLWPQDVGFESACGPLDHMRGQKFLFRIELPLRSFQEDCLFNLIVDGNKPNDLPFHYVVRMPALCTGMAPNVPINPEVDVYLKLVEASKAVRDGNIEQASRIYTSMGQDNFSCTLRQMSDAGEDEESTSRGTESFANSALTNYIAQRRAEEAQGEKP